MRYLRYLFLCVLIFNRLSAHLSELWTGDCTHLINRGGHLAVAVKRGVPIDALTDREKLELEGTVGKMENVFQEVFGFGDFLRWMPLGCKEVVSYLFPAGATAEIDEVNFESRVRLMLFALNDREENAIPLNEGQLNKIQSVAQRVLSGNPSPVSLQDATLSWTKVQESFLAIANEIKTRGGQFDLEWSGETTRIVSYTGFCRVFCKNDILKKQCVYATASNRVLSNPRPYVDHHLMVIPNRHITTLSESSDEEIIDKYALFTMMNAVARNGIRCPKTGILTRIGWRSGQTQSHLHDHFLGYDPQAIHPWMLNFAYEISHPN